MRGAIRCFDLAAIDLRERVMKIATLFALDECGSLSVRIKVGKTFADKENGLETTRLLWRLCPYIGKA